MRAFIPVAVAIVAVAFLGVSAHRSDARDSVLSGPRCRPADAPILLSGAWLAVPGSHATERITVRRATVRRYLRARLTIHIPPRLRPKVARAYKAHAHTLTVVARCYRGTFIAALVDPR
jgi:hypothetical protein